MSDKIGRLALQHRVAALEAENHLLKADAENHVKHIEALEQKYAGCPHKPINGEVDSCGCSFDDIGDKCDYHAPALRKAKADAQRLYEALKHCKDVIDSLDPYYRYTPILDAARAAIAAHEEMK